jgi:hypothetical protein
MGKQFYGLQNAFANGTIMSNSCQEGLIALQELRIDPPGFDYSELPSSLQMGKRLRCDDHAG